MRAKLCVQLRSFRLGFQVEDGGGTVLFPDDDIVMLILLVGEAIMLAEVLVLVGAECLADPPEGEDSFGLIGIRKFDLFNVFIGDDLRVIEAVQGERGLVLRDRDRAEKDREHEGKDRDRDEAERRDEDVCAAYSACHITTNPFP